MGTYTEVSYKSASKLLGGKALQGGDEMGGFFLGSTVVLVFEAPASFQFNVSAGETVKMGQPLGEIVESTVMEEVAVVEETAIASSAA